ncbi:hypothetical protein GCM10009544_44480 [Streptomyces stramineus]|uniref:Uncharacterized protein n=1 Tax=Streptomyces stramineus TaxID=173861 RepID=A0ABP3KE58_9ACTN
MLISVLLMITGGAPTATAHAGEPETNSLSTSLPTESAPLDEFAGSPAVPVAARTGHGRRPGRTGPPRSPAPACGPPRAPFSLRPLRLVNGMEQAAAQGRHTILRC